MGLFSQPSYPNPQNVTPQLTPEQQKLQSTAAQFLTSQVGQPAPAYTGPFTAGLTGQQVNQIGGMGQGAAASYPTQAAGLGALGALASGAGTPTALGATGAGTLGNYAAGSYLPGGGRIDPFLGAALGGTAQAAEQQFAGSIPAIRGPFVASGQTGFSSPEEAALGGAAAQFATGLQSNLANQALGTYTTEQQNQLNAANTALQAYMQGLGIQAGAAPQAAAIPVTTQEAALQAATMPQQTQQAQLTAQYQDWLRQLGGAWQAAGVPAFSTLAAQTGYQYPNVYGPSPFQSLLGGASSLAGPAAYFFGGSPGAGTGATAAGGVPMRPTAWY